MLPRKLFLASATAVALLAGMTQARADGDWRWHHHGGGEHEWREHEWHGHEWRRAWRPEPHVWLYAPPPRPYYVPPPAYYAPPPYGYGYGWR